MYSIFYVPFSERKVCRLLQSPRQLSVQVVQSSNAIYKKLPTTASHQDTRFTKT